ncbi:MAG: hypothetical protein DI585_01635 [Pseudomonas fluorescens]|nr:MAG: hypothetical protein DI585_01635 [Pseudomonas fluorescens]
MRIPAYLAAFLLAAIATPVTTALAATPQPAVEGFLSACPAEESLIRNNALPFKASSRSVGFSKPTSTYLKIDTLPITINNTSETAAGELQSAVDFGNAYVVIAPWRQTWALFGSPRPDIPCSQLTSEMPVDDTLKTGLQLEDQPPLSPIEQNAAKLAATSISPETTGAISPVGNTGYAGTSCERFIRNEISGSIDGNAILLPLVVQNDRLATTRGSLIASFKGGQKTTDTIRKQNLPAWYVISFSNSQNIRKGVQQMKPMVAMNSYTVKSAYAAPGKCVVDSGKFMSLTDSSPALIKEVVTDLYRHGAQTGQVEDLEKMLKVIQSSSREGMLDLIDDYLVEAYRRG